MKMIIGLGNPGVEYEMSRHNAGFMVVDNLVEACGGGFKRFRFNGSVARVRWCGEEIVVGRPTTFMNRSGHFVSSVVQYFKVGFESLLVVCDDMDLPLGRLRLSRRGGSAGHRGMQSIIDQLGTNEFARLRVGIGRPDPGGDPVDFVLSRFREEEFVVLRDVIEQAVEAARFWASEGLDRAMNRFNQVPVVSDR